MNKKDVIRMAREAGIDVAENNSFADDMYISVLYRFANIVSAVEREGCAELTDEFFNTGRNWAQLADAIRARREQ